MIQHNNSYKAIQIIIHMVQNMKLQFFEALLSIWPKTSPERRLELLKVGPDVITIFSERNCVLVVRK